MKHHFVWISSVYALCLLSSCFDDTDISNPSEELFLEQQREIAQYLEEQGIDAEQAPDGVYYQVLRENPDGEAPEPGNVVNIYYQITQLDGTLIDELDSASGEPPLPYTFRNNALVRENNMISPRRMDPSVAQMREGEIYRFFLPSEYAYLNYALEGEFPSQANVIVEIYLVEVLTQTERVQRENEIIKTHLAEKNLLAKADSLAGGIYYVATDSGSGPAVSNGDTVALRYTGSFLDGTVFDSNINPDDDLLRFVIGSQQVIPGFEIAVAQMQQGEKGTVIIPSRAAYGEGVIALPYEIIVDQVDNSEEFRRLYGPFVKTFPPYTILRFDLEVVSVQS